MTNEDQRLIKRFIADKSDDDESDDVVSDHPSRRVAYRLALAGQPDDALRTLLQNDNGHPWVLRLDRVQVLALGRQTDRALDEALALVQDFPDKEPIEFITSQLCEGAGRLEEALKHAQSAYRQLPCKGLQVWLARQQWNNRHAEEAWALVEKLHYDRPMATRIRALAAEETNRLDEAENAWRRYVEQQPEDTSARVRYAQLLFRMHKPEEAATVAWKLFVDHGDKLDMETLHIIGALQRLAGAPDQQQAQRIKDIATRLKQRFSSDATAEFLRLQLLTLLGGELPEDQEPIDFSKLIDAGHVMTQPVSKLIQFLEQQNTLSTAVAQLARKGAIPTSTACGVSGTQAALFVTRILRQDDRAGFMCPPVSMTDQPPPILLRGATLLISDVELLLVEVLDFTKVLKDALGPGGQVVLFPRSRQRVEDDFVSLRIDANPGKLATIEELLRQVERLPEVEADPSARLDDAAAARKNGAAIVAHEASPDTQHISPRAFVDYLRDQGCIDDDKHTRLRLGLPDGLSSQLAADEAMPTRIIVPPYLIEMLYREDVLFSVFRSRTPQLFRGPRTRAYFELSATTKHIRSRLKGSLNGFMVSSGRLG